MGLPTAVEDKQVSMLANLQRAVGVGAAEGVGGVDGGGGQNLRHGHPHVDTGQVHDDGLRGESGRIREWKSATHHAPVLPWNSRRRWG